MDIRQLQKQNDTTYVDNNNMIKYFKKCKESINCAAGCGNTRGQVSVPVQAAGQEGYCQ